MKRWKPYVALILAIGLLLAEPLHVLAMENSGEKIEIEETTRLGQETESTTVPEQEVKNTIESVQEIEDTTESVQEVGSKTEPEQEVTDTVEAEQEAENTTEPEEVGDTVQSEQKEENVTQSEQEAEEAAELERKIAEQKQYRPQLSPLESVDYEFERAEDGARGTYPATFDSRNYGYVTDVKNQGKWGTCWAFASMAAAESSALKRGINAFPDYSELHTAYFYYNRVNDPLGGTKKDSNNGLGSDYLERGGNPILAAQALATWSGIADETLAPYLPYDRPANLSSNIAYKDSVILKNAYFLSGDKDEIKGAILKYGAVVVAYDDDDTYYNYKTCAYSKPYDNVSNHSVVIVGWDDNYSASNFNAASRVSRNGAWIVKNSWSPNWGDNGYFYLSYEDATMVDAVVLDVVDAGTYDYNYQYDGNSVFAYTHLNDGQSLANVFTIQDNGKTTGQEVTAVQFSVYTANVDYSIQIYTKMTEKGNPYSGTPQLKTPQTGRIGNGGIYTIDLKNPVFLRNGGEYAVVVTFSGKDIIDVGVEMNSSSSGFIAGIDEGQSYEFYSYWGWYDLSQQGCCARIKAFTKQSNRKPETPQNFKASVDKSSVTLTWNQVDSADGYVIYRKAPNESQFSYKGMVTSNRTTTYKDTSVTRGSKYSYMVYSYYTYAGGKLMLSNAGTNISVIGGVSSATNLKGASAGKNKVKLTWNAAKGAEGYIIYRKVGDGSFSYLYILSSDRLSYTDLKASDTEYNYYRVYPYITVNGKRVVGLSDSYVYAKGVCPAVTNLKPASTSQGVRLTWTGSPDAEGYLIYGIRGDNGKYGYIGMMTKGTTFTDTKAYKTQYNFYWVFPYHKNSAGKMIVGGTPQYVYGRAK